MAWFVATVEDANVAAQINAVEEPPEVVKCRPACPTVVELPNAPLVNVAVYRAVAPSEDAVRPEVAVVTATIVPPAHCPVIPVAVTAMDACPVPRAK